MNVALSPGPSPTPRAPAGSRRRARWWLALAVLLACAAAWPGARAAAVAVVGVGAGARARQPARGQEPVVRRAWFVMGTRLEVTVVAHAVDDRHGGRELAAAAAAARAAYEAVRAVDRLASLYREDSELVRLNRAAGAGPVPVSAELSALLVAAQRFARLSGGAFDATVTPLVRLWGFYRLEQFRVPPPAALRAARARVGPGQVRLLPDGRVELAAGTELDLGAIAKGWAVDRALERLRARGVVAALVNLGGNVGVLGAPPGRAAWEIAVRHPRRPQEALGVLLLHGPAAASTSGDYERFFEVAGARYGHVIDPRTGAPVREVVATTVVAPSATTADALSTAAMVLGPLEGLRLLRRCAGAEGLTVTVTAGDAGPGAPTAAGDDARLLVRATSGLRWRPRSRSDAIVRSVPPPVDARAAQPCSGTESPGRS